MIAVVVDHLERAVIDLGALGRASQGDPQLLVEIFQIRQIFAAREQHLIDATARKKRQVCSEAAMGRGC